MEKTYLGDSVYAEFDGYQIRLFLNNGYEDKSEIFLDSHVVDAFLLFIDHIKRGPHGDDMASFFQVLSRVNDKSGNPYRLVMVYGGDGDVVEMTEARSSSPDVIKELVRRGYVQLPSIFISVGEYRSFTVAFKRVLKEE